MKRIALTTSDIGVVVEYDDDLTVADLQWSRGNAEPAKARVAFADGSIHREPPTDDIDAEFYVVDLNGPPGPDRWVGRFATQAEAEACIVGLDYLDRSGTKAGRYAIDGPEQPVRTKGEG